LCTDWQESKWVELPRPQSWVAQGKSPFDEALVRRKIPNKKLLQLLQACWSSKEKSRPPIHEVVKKLQKIGGFHVEERESDVDDMNSFSLPDTPPTETTTIGGLSNEEGSNNLGNASFSSLLNTPPVENTTIGDISSEEIDLGDASSSSLPHTPPMENTTIGEASSEENNLGIASSSSLLNTPPEKDCDVGSVEILSDMIPPLETTALIHAVS
jgi:hypothetical protein